MGNLDFKNLAKIADDTQRKDDKRQKRIADHKAKEQFNALKKRIKDELEETESTEEAVEVVNNIMAEAGSDPAEVTKAAIEVMSEAVDFLEEKANTLEADKKELETELADSKKNQKPEQKKVMDADTFKAFKKKVKDALEETESTEEATTTVTEFLEEAAPEDVVKAAVEVLAEAVDQLQTVVDSKKIRDSWDDFVMERDADKIIEYLKTNFPNRFTEEELNKIPTQVNKPGVEWPNDKVRIKFDDYAYGPGLKIKTKEGGYLCFYQAKD